MRYWMLIGLLFSSSLWAQDTDQTEDRKAGVAHFQDSRYGYAAANLMHLNLDYDNYELTPTGLGLRLGGMVDENWGVELRLATAPSGDTRRSDTSRKVELEEARGWVMSPSGVLRRRARLPLGPLA